MPVPKDILDSVNAMFKREEQEKAQRDIDAAKRFREHMSKGAIHWDGHIHDCQKCGGVVKFVDFEAHEAAHAVLAKKGDSQ